MELYPAIDLKDGKAVRLTKGLMESAKIYSDEPWQLAKSFEEAGAKWLHVVDLNGAFAGQPANLEQIEKIRQNCGLKIQLGGGIRDEATIRRYGDLGIDRLILGSIAARDPEFVIEMAKEYPLAVGIDAIDGMVALEGWAQKSRVPATDLAARFQDSAVRAIVCTDVGKDGTLSGVNVDYTLAIKAAFGGETIASGGVKGLEDLRALAETGKVDGAIIGKAYYEGKLDIKQAFTIMRP